MTENPTPKNFDAIPFAARAGWTSDADYEAWWEDPRDLLEIVVSPEAGTALRPEDVTVSYWQSVWPGVRVPKGAPIGSGRTGWQAIDDWTNGRWQEADIAVDRVDGGLRVTFGPINASEFPDETDFPATFRRTLKLRLSFAAGARGRVSTVQAFTDSEWRESDVTIEWRAPDGTHACRDGRLEAFNGAVSGVVSLGGPVTVADHARWRSQVSLDSSAGICAHIRYAHNDDPNTYDRTIVTVRCEDGAFSFLMDDVLHGEPIYVRALGALVARADSGHRLAAWETRWEQGHPDTLHRRIAQMPEQTWENAWAGMPPKARRLYFVLAPEGARQKFGVNPNGDIFLGKNFIRRVPGRDTPLLGWEGDELRYRFGLPAEPDDRGILENTLPIVHAAWTSGDGVCYEQEALATWLRGTEPGVLRPGDDPAVCLVRFRLTNLTEASQVATLAFGTAVDDTPEVLTVRDGEVYADDRLRALFDANGRGALASGSAGLAYTLSLEPGDSHTIFMTIPFLQPDSNAAWTRLAGLRYEEERVSIAAYWRARIAQGAQIETPVATLNAFYRTHLMHMLVINDREPGADRNVARCGGFHYGSFPDEGIMVVSDLDRRGYLAEAERCLELYVKYQGTAPLPGNFSSAEGVFYGSGGYEVAGYNRNQGWVLWGLAEHYRYTRDRAWLARVAPALVAGCDWITRERAATMTGDANDPRPIQYGFLPPGSLEDVTDYWTWLSTNAYAYLGLRSAADVLAEIGHPEAARLAADADAYRHDLHTGFIEAATRSPVVRLRDGSWVPHFPPRLERRGRDFGWLREVLEGAAHLIYCGIIAPDEPAAQWIIDDYEDNLFNSDQYGYPAPDFEAQWFGWGGFSMQPNLLIWPHVYLWRDEPEHYLRAVFNPFAAAFYPDTGMLTEHPLPTLADWAGDHFKTSDEANHTYWLRLMFFAEHGEELFVGQAIPRAWFAEGREMRVERALTHFGEASVSFLSRAATGEILVRLAPPTRNPPRRIRLRVRHPDRTPMRRVWVDGLPHPDFDPDREIITVQGATSPLEIKIQY